MIWKSWISKNRNTVSIYIKRNYYICLRKIFKITVSASLSCFVGVLTFKEIQEHVGEVYDDNADTDTDIDIM